MNKPADIKAANTTAAEVFLKRLKAHGVDYFFSPRTRHGTRWGNKIIEKTPPIANISK